MERTIDPWFISRVSMQFYESLRNRFFLQDALYNVVHSIRIFFIVAQVEIIVHRYLLFDGL